MNIQKVSLFLFLFIWYIEGSAQSSCISGNCDNGTGVYVYSSDSRYDGEWKNGKQNGHGKYIYKNGSIYDGEWLDGKKNGFGKYTYPNGSYYEGNYKNGVEAGEGKYVSASGTVQTGTFVNGFLNGKATIEYKDGEKHIGNFVNDTMQGKGTINYANGDKFVGNFKDGKMNGQGVLTTAKGGTLTGLWVNDVFKSGSNETSLAINLVKSAQGVWETPVLINGVLKLDMIFDSGASEVYLTPQIMLTLFAAKTITDDDILDGGKYVTANGEVNTSVRFRIKELEIGGKIITDIPAGVSTSVDGMNLLGLSALEKLGALEIDFVKGTITTK